MWLEKHVFLYSKKTLLLLALLRNISTVIGSFGNVMLLDLARLIKQHCCSTLTETKMA